ncbi:MAG: sensor domain-containing diguanylate cyclase [Candidatus Omnitrophota bacterium]
MTHYRDKSLCGVLTVTLSIVAACLLVLSSSHNTPRTPFFSGLFGSAIFIFNIAILCGWMAYGKGGGAASTVLAVIIAFFEVLRSGQYGYLLFIVSFFPVTFAGYAYYKANLSIENLYALKSEKLEEDMNLLASYAGDKHRSITALEEKLKKYSILKEVTERLSALLSLEDINKLLTEKVAETIGKSGRVLLFLVDFERQELMLSASSLGAGDPKVKTKRGDPFDYWVLRHRKPLIVEDITKDFRFPIDESEKAASYFRSLISAPLISANNVLGVLRVDSRREFSYTQEDLRLLDILSDLGAVAVQNAILYARTQELAIKDGLTGLFLRRHFMERLREECRRAARKKGSLSVIMMDIDHFKEYNDRYGHTAGDLVLKHLAGIVTSGIREGDMAARYGGEEIAVLLPGADRRSVTLTAEAIRKRVEENHFVLRRQKMPITVSIGISTYPQEAVLEEELIRIADERLYKAKIGGRNRLCAD